MKNLLILNALLLSLLLPINAYAQNDAACLVLLKTGLQAMVDNNDDATMYFSDRFDEQCEMTESLNALGDRDAELARLDALTEPSVLAAQKSKMCFGYLHDAMNSYYQDDLKEKKRANQRFDSAGCTLDKGVIELAKNSKSYTKVYNALVKQGKIIE